MCLVFVRAGQCFVNGHTALDVSVSHFREFERAPISYLHIVYKYNMNVLPLK